MNNTRLSQYTHRPNATELGMGNTHETYMLISADTDLSHIFPPSQEVKVRDMASGKGYVLKSANGREFRVNQMGELYRDYNVLPGDEIVITKIEKNDASDIFVNVRQFARTVFMVGSNGSEIINIDRLEKYLTGNKVYNVLISDRGNTNRLSISFRESRKKRQDSPGTTDYYNVMINGEKLANGTYYLTLGNPLSSLSMLPKAEFNEVSFDESVLNKIKPSLSPGASLDISPTYHPYLTAIRTKPFLLLAGISGTGKSRIVRELAFKSCPKYLQDKDGTTPGNYCMIEVKPNWHDSTELLGYYSNLSKSYQFKKFVKFLVKAKLNPHVPFFVCLDEMNLAPVEHYFAEILSIIETRKHPKKQNSDEIDMRVIKTGVVVENKYFKEVTKTDENGIERHKLNMTDKDWYENFYDVATMSEGEKTQIAKYQYERTLQEEGLTLPDNVIIIGTVNMDDTTHQFSRKVIDRAMTIEMNGGKLSEMYGGSKNLEYLSEEEQKKWQGAFRQRYVTADEVLKAHADETEDIKKKVPARLEEINKALKGTPFEVSYRVLNELTIMIGVMLDAPEEGSDIDSIINKAVDRILLMKILPRIEGDSDMFNLSQEFQRKQEVKYSNRLEWLKELAPAIVDENDEKYQQTARGKIQEMIDRLENQEFTRFWP